VLKMILVLVAIAMHSPGRRLAFAAGDGIVKGAQLFFNNIRLVIEQAMALISPADLALGHSRHRRHKQILERVNDEWRGREAVGNVRTAIQSGTDHAKGRRRVGRGRRRGWRRRGSCGGCRGGGGSGRRSRGRDGDGRDYRRRRTEFAERRRRRQAANCSIGQHQDGYN
jgi:hypothetical protein